MTTLPQYAGATTLDHVGRRPHPWLALRAPHPPGAGTCGVVRASQDAQGTARRRGGATADVSQAYDRFGQKVTTNLRPPKVALIETVAPSKPQSPPRTAPPARTASPSRASQRGGGASGNGALAASRHSSSPHRAAAEKDRPLTSPRRSVAATDGGQSDGLRTSRSKPTTAAASRAAGAATTRGQPPMLASRLRAAIVDELGKVPGRGRACSVRSPRWRRATPRATRRQWRPDDHARLSSRRRRRRRRLRSSSRPSE